MGRGGSPPVVVATRPELAARSTETSAATSPARANIASPARRAIHAGRVVCVVGLSVVSGGREARAYFLLSLRLHEVAELLSTRGIGQPNLKDQYHSYPTRTGRSRKAPSSSSSFLLPYTDTHCTTTTRHRPLSNKAHTFTASTQISEPLTHAAASHASIEIAPALLGLEDALDVDRRPRGESRAVSHAAAAFAASAGSDAFSQPPI